MSSIKPKEGACNQEGCSYFGRTIGKKCPTHYWRHRASLKKDKATGGLKTRETKRDELNEWFRVQISMIPTYCEECGTNLTGWKHTMPKAIIAHILPKRKVYGFPSVATHPLNRMFFCPDCHTNYDQGDRDSIVKMASYETMKKRVQTILVMAMPEDEQRRLPIYFT